MRNCLFILLLIFFSSKLAWSKPGDTYHCQKAVGKFIDTNIYGERDWGNEDFYFKWTEANTIVFTMNWASPEANTIVFTMNWHSRL